MGSVARGTSTHRGSRPAHRAPQNDAGADHLREREVTVIDLRALRPEFFDSEVLPEGLRQAIVSFDAYVAIPDMRHSEPLNPVPRGE